MSDIHTSESVITSPQGDYDALSSVSPETPCPYLPDRLSRSEAYYVEHLHGSMYERLLARGFRRSGRIVYRPRCRQCRECRSLRIRTADFSPTKSMRRVQRRNADVRVTIDPKPTATPDKFTLYQRYLDSQHDDTMDRSCETFKEFLYDSPTDTCEFRYELGDRLIGVSLLDRWAGGMSSVYMYFDPDFAARSLGTYSVLFEIDYCRSEGIPYYYLGYHVAGSRTMAYKARFRPHELLVGDDHWLTIPA